MPAGCDFICRNEECEHIGKGIVVLGPWAIGNIGLIINSKKVENMEEFREGLIKLKDDGRKYACINYPLPDLSDIPVEGYRVQRWCDACKFIWQYDVVLDEDHKTFDEAMKIADVPDKCVKCDGEVQDFEALIESGNGLP